jgi:hypothetical protein
MAGSDSSAMWLVAMSGPSPFANRSTVTVTSPLRSANARTARSASTMSFSSSVRGGCGRRIASVK